MDTGDSSAPGSQKYSAHLQLRYGIRDGNLDTLEASSHQHLQRSQQLIIHKKHSPSSKHLLRPSLSLSFLQSIALSNHSVNQSFNMKAFTIAAIISAASAAAIPGSQPQSEWGQLTCAASTVYVTSTLPAPAPVTNTVTAPAPPAVTSTVKVTETQPAPAPVTTTVKVTETQPAPAPVTVTNTVTLPAPAPVTTTVKVTETKPAPAPVTVTNTVTAPAPPAVTSTVKVTETQPCAVSTSSAGWGKWS